MRFLPSIFRFPSKLRRRARRSRMATLVLLVVVVIVFVTPLYIVYKPPNLLIRYFQQRWPDVLWQVPISSKTIALTIDDGPSEYTEEILQVLKDNGAAATFFIIGAQVAGRQKILEDIVRNGNELGNHAMHDEPSRSLTDDVLINEVMSVKLRIQEAYAAVEVQEPPNYFRPGSGFFSTRMRRILQALDYRLVLGSIYPHDPQISFWTLNARHILSMLRPGGIIVCHDRRSWTLPMLKRVLPEARSRGYKVVTVTELLRESWKTRPRND